jgi:hypothetical protein
MTARSVAPSAAVQPKPVAAPVVEAPAQAAPAPVEPVAVVEAVSAPPAAALIRPSTATVPAVRTALPTATRSVELPAAPALESARGLRTAFNVSHPSPKPVSDIMTEVKRVINMNRIQCQFDSLWSPHGPSGPTPTVLFCEKGPIRFEMEVSHVAATAPGASDQHVVRMKRVSGDSWAYKNLCNRIIPQLRM